MEETTSNISTRAKAIALGLNKYFTGKPCKHGHVDYRWIAGGCITCKRQDGNSPANKASKLKHSRQPQAKRNRQEWAAKNQAHVKAYHKVYNADPVYKLSKRAAKYDITPDDYNKMLQDQDNQCAICKDIFTGTPFIDHDHSTDKVRGLLCSGCNFGLGYFKDNIPSLKQSIQYLRRANAS